MVQMSALKEELISYINDIPDNKLQAIKPLLYLLPSDSMTIEKVSFDDLTEDEKEAVIQGRKEYENGECTDFEDYLKERNIS